MSVNFCIISGYGKKNCCASEETKLLHIHDLWSCVHVDVILAFKRLGILNPCIQNIDRTLVSSFLRRTSGAVHQQQWNIVVCLPFGSFSEEETMSVNQT